MASKCKMITLFVLLTLVSFSWIIYKRYDRANRRIPPKRSAILRKVDPEIPDTEYNLTILDWGPAFFSERNGLLTNTRYGNCLITHDRSKLDKSDAVVIEVRKIKHLSDMPPTRHPWQRWIYLNVESPHHAITDYKGNYKMADFKGKLAFNWTMTYRTDSDVPMYHGWTVKKTAEEAKRKHDISNITSGRNKSVAAIITNCYQEPNHRMTYVRELQKYIPVDVYGGCGKQKLVCEGYFKHPCYKMQQYKFYLAFENSNCRDYITEKMWWHGFQQGAIPIVLGAYKDDYLKQAPPNSIIFVEDFKSPKELSNYLKMLMQNETAYNAFHDWRKTFTIGVDFMFMGNRTWPKLCNTLTKRYHEKAKWYDVITDFESVESDCFQNEWIKTHLVILVYLKLCLFALIFVTFVYILYRIRIRLYQKWQQKWTLF